MTASRYPLQPLAALLGIALGTWHGDRTGIPGDDIDTLAQLAQRLNITHRHARRLLQLGLTETQADTFAARLDLHPQDIWPEWFDDYELDTDALDWLTAWDQAWANWHPPMTPPQIDP